MENEKGKRGKKWRKNKRIDSERKISLKSKMGELLCYCTVDTVALQCH